MRPPAAPCEGHAASDSASPSRRTRGIPGENSGCYESYSGSFLRRVPHRFAWSPMRGVSQAASFGKSGSSAAKIVLAFSIAFFALASEASATPP